MGGLPGRSQERFGRARSCSRWLWHTSPCIRGFRGLRCFSSAGFWCCQHPCSESVWCACILTVWRRLRSIIWLWCPDRYSVWGQHTCIRGHQHTFVWRLWGFQHPRIWCLQWWLAVWRR